MLAVLRQFRIVVRSITRHYGWVALKTGVSGAQLWAMAQIDTAPGMKVSELARKLAIHQSTASNLLDRLQHAGLIRRQRVGHDQRVVRLHLTAKGKHLLGRAPRPLRGVLQQALMDLPSGSLRALHHHLEELIHLMKVRDLEGRAMPLSEAMDGTKR